MPSFAQSLEKTLHGALQNATDRSHEYATLEHLLLALVDDPDAIEVMTACGVDMDELSGSRPRTTPTRSRPPASSG